MNGYILYHEVSVAGYRILRPTIQIKTGCYLTYKINSPEIGNKAWIQLPNTLFIFY